MATIASSGTGEASTRCCQPAMSSRFVRTWRNPLSESTTARRMAACVVGVIVAPAYVAGPTPTRLVGIPVTPWSQPVHPVPGDPACSGKSPLDVGGVREIPAEPPDDEGDL